VLWKYNGENVPYTYARIDLFPSYTSILDVENAMFNESGLNYQQILYESAVYRNWNIGYLKNAFQLVNKQLLDEKEKWMFEEISTESLKNLKLETLYIPESALIKFGKFTGDESQKHSVESLLKNYKYKYQIIADDKLSDMISEEETEIYYLSYVKSCTDKFFSVINSKTGEIIYTTFDNLSYNLEAKDFTSLSKEILLTK
jgi:hypothetical protein